ncbi:hypothetical protein AAVH_29372 [Aphelenchoides avenae]|nr:hypothetical protein AAVH_29372 [Aphelenchus avenae]
MRTPSRYAHAIAKCAYDAVIRMRYVIANNICFFAAEWLYGVAHPEPLFPHPILLGRGLSRYVPSTDFSRNLYMNVGIFLAMSVAYFMVAQFLFRYCQTTDNWLYEVLSNFKYSALMYVAAMTVGTCTVIVPLGFNWASADELLDYMKGVDVELFEKMLDTPCFVGMKTASSLTYITAASAAVALGAGGTLVAVWSTLCCYRFLRNNHSSLSQRTIALYRSLINALVLDVAIGFAVVFFPMLISVAALTFENAYGSIIALISMTVVNWYPLLTHAILLTNVKPYRMALIVLCRRVIHRKKELREYKKRSTRISSIRLHRDSFIAF